MAQEEIAMITEEGTSIFGNSNLHWVDYVVIVGYFVGVIVVGIVSSMKSQRNSVSGYFLASRNMHWIPVGASLFASNIGSGHFIGLAGSGAASGIGVATYELNAIFILMVLGWIFVPVYMAAGVITMPEYLRARFGGQRIRVFLSVLALLLYVFTKISADLYAGALFIKLAMGLQGEAGLYTSILVLLGIAALFTIGGGLSAVIWTDFVQTILMVVGSLALMVQSLLAVGGYEALLDAYSTAEPDPEFSAFFTDSNGQNVSCSGVQENFMHMMRPADAPGSDLPWTGVVFGISISSIWYWCADQVTVQRTLAARNVTHAKAGCILAAFLKFLPLFLLVLPGMAARVLYKNEVACSDPTHCLSVCGSATGCSNIAYVRLVLDLMPTGAKGMMLAVMMAALMSSLTSIFNSSSTVFTIDIWTRLRGKASDTELLIVGRSFVIVLVAVSVIWIPIITKFNSSQLFVYIQAISNFLSPQVTAVFLLGILWERTTEPGAFWGLIIGFTLGIIRFGLEFGYFIPPCGSGIADTRPDFIKHFVDDVHYLHYGAFLFVVTGIVTIVISLMTEPIAKDKLYRLTFWTRNSKLVRNGFDEEEDDKKGDSVIDDDTIEEDGGFFSEIIKTICGLSTENSENNGESVEEVLEEKTKEEKAADAAEFLEEDPTWSFITSCMSVVAMAVALFIMAFYA